MDRRIAIFWGSAVGAAIGFAAVALVLLPYEALRIHTDAERQRAWLLTLWTGGVFAILFGASALLGAFRGIGFREVHEAGDVAEAAERHRTEVRRRGGEPFHRSFAWWTISTGALLVAVYFAGWFVLER